MAKIYESPSSQQANIGVVPGYTEEIACNRIAEFADALLIKAGQEIKRNNPALRYDAFVTESNAWGADKHICYHTNASADPNKHGIAIGCYNPDDPTRSSTKLAKAIQKRLQGIYAFGEVVLVKYTFAEITQVNADTAYIECGYHTNEQDCKWVWKNPQTIGETIAYGILDDLGIEYREATTPAPDLSGALQEATAKVVFLTNEVAASQSEIASLKSQLAAKDSTITQITAEIASVKPLAEKYQMIKRALE